VFIKATSVALLLLTLAALSFSDAEARGSGRMGGMRMGGMHMGGGLSGLGMGAAGRLFPGTQSGKPVFECSTERQCERLRKSLSLALLCNCG
jgi:hypothetical protein